MSESKLVSYGYASGMYTCKCSNCESEFLGDKRAIRCLPCALKASKHRYFSSCNYKNDKEMFLDMMKYIRELESRNNEALKQLMEAVNDMPTYIGSTVYARKDLMIEAINKVMG